jgi:acylaminoacyl-peptidase
MRRILSGLLSCVGICALLNLGVVSSASGDETTTATEGAFFQPEDVFQLEYASDPQISPKGEHVVYVRNFMDIMTDRRRSNLWMMSFDGSEHRPLTTGQRNDSSPRWSPDGKRLLYLSRGDESTQIFVRWMDTGQTAQLSHVTESPRGVVWSPDGQWIAFSMLVPSDAKPFAKMPTKPDGAEWAKPPRVIEKLHYRRDGGGYVEAGYSHLFVLPADGGTPRAVTSGPFNHNDAPAWTADSRALVFSSNYNAEWEYDPVESELYVIPISGGEAQQVTHRDGPDRSPAVSPDGRTLAYIGFDDQNMGYHNVQLYVADLNGGASRSLTGDLDRSVRAARWDGNGRGLYFLYDEQGDTKLGYVAASGGAAQVLADRIGGTSIGRPYSGGSYSVSNNDRFALTLTAPEHPADVAVGSKPSALRAASQRSADRIDFGLQRLTQLNDDLFGHKELGKVEEIWYESTYDGRSVQGWIVRPPGFDRTRKYPLVLEIHGGPFANYGPRFSTEVQLYAAAGNVVLYTNPRGSTSYGGEFANLIHHNYPGQDYDDLMAGVDAVVAHGYVDEENLFVTGGSGGGVLTSWIVGKTGRFRAAVVAKPVINWYSFVLTSDVYPFFAQYWFPGFPWDHLEHYMERSPISLVGNVTTPTMLLTGESDYRTPMSETEQFYQALKLRKIDTALVRIPGASHGIASRPSNLIAKVQYILAWFDRYNTAKEEAASVTADRR